VVALAVGTVMAVMPTGGAARAAASGARPGAIRPNIVVVLTDDLDATTYDPARFPALHDLMTTQGLTFSRFFVNDSLCCPSRASILRGQYVHNTKVLNNGPPTGGFEKFYARGEERSTVATWLHAAGYRTGLFGKYLNGYPDTASPHHVPPGWDRWVSPSGGNPYGEYHYQLNLDGRLVEYGGQPADYLVDVLSQQADQFVGSAGRRPFFAYIAPYVPHEPATPAPRYAHAFAGVTAPHTPSFDQLRHPIRPSGCATARRCRSRSRITSTSSTAAVSRTCSASTTCCATSSTPCGAPASWTTRTSSSAATTASISVSTGCPRGRRRRSRRTSACR
jgi:N-acetylglucosamine-6-sulfatase